MRRRTRLWCTLTLVDSFQTRGMPESCIKKLSRTTRKLVESAYIRTNVTTNHSGGAMRLSRATVRLTLCGLRHSRSVPLHGDVG
ncbi:hypothetical protein E2C01_101567 [Portunus trituberculatus]|uniref:Uncharacterized protein n=1 Tax=Portunus trituberculatus TaxID=210409 RepID=A0A5B7KKQ9_PORTR|nr:hypothetical protein [Portunus trituberculatus]